MRPFLSGRTIAALLGPRVEFMMPTSCYFNGNGYAAAYLVSTGDSGGTYGEELRSSQRTGAEALTARASTLRQ
jgi:hypothetical protein